MDELEQLAFETIAQIYPHEIYALRPGEFWELFHRTYPSISREQMEDLLSSTKGKIG